MDYNISKAEGSSSVAASSAASDSDDSGDGEDEPSSPTLGQELEHFREQWRQELEKSLPNVANKSTVDDKGIGVDKLDKAKNLFLQGVCAEQNGCLHEAVHFYKRAIQLVPDIEFKISEGTASKLKFENCLYEESYEGIYNFSAGRENVNDEDDNIDNDDYAIDEENGQIQDLVTHFRRLMLKRNQLCMQEYEQKMTHISILPKEIILYLFRWVVSSDLDLRSLEQLSMVCRGFYLCARDPEIWRLACLKVWDINVGSPNKYGSWRNMFVERPRLRFNGAYISKTTYVRHGENSFQDQFYRPWHLVAYFRYLRFFPEGIVLMLTTPDDPYTSLSKLKQRSPKHSAILAGQYRLHCNSVVAILKRAKQGDNYNHYQRYKRYRQNNNNDAGEQTFHIELEMRNCKGKLNYQLIWTHYAIHTVYRNGTESISEFELQQNNFPPFWFSRVKSYTAESENLLQ